MMSSLCAAIKMLLGFVGRWDIKQRPLSPIRLPSFLSPFIFPHLFFVHSVDAEQLLVIKGTSEPRTMLNQKKKKECGETTKTKMTLPDWNRRAS